MNYVTTILMQIASLQHQRACLRIRRGAVVGSEAEWRGATRENTLHGSSTEEQRSQSASGAKTLPAAALLSVGRVRSVGTVRCGDFCGGQSGPALAAARLPILSQALPQLGMARETTGRNCGRIYAYDKYLKFLSEGTEP
jgi:hypothetical protein